METQPSYERPTECMDRMPYAAGSRASSRGAKVMRLGVLLLPSFVMLNLSRASLDAKRFVELEYICFAGLTNDPVKMYGNKFLIQNRQDLR